MKKRGTPGAAALMGLMGISKADCLSFLKGWAIGTSPILLAYLIVMSRFKDRLRASHPETYWYLSPPPPPNHPEIEGYRDGGLAIAGFVLSGRFKVLGDADLSALGRVCRMLLILGIIGNAVMFLTAGISFFLK